MQTMLLCPDFKYLDDEGVEIEVVRQGRSTPVLKNKITNMLAIIKLFFQGATPLLAVFACNM